jgi:gas vesicle protein
MAVTNTQHLLVYQRAREQWGDETAEALMEMLPPAGLDVATKQDVAGVQTYLSKDIAQLRTDVGKDIAQLRTDVGKDIAQVRTDLSKEIEQVRTDLGKDISSACSELRSHTWKVTVGTGVGLYILLIGTPYVQRLLG